MPGTLVGPEDTAVTNQIQVSSHMDPTLQLGRDGLKKKKPNVCVRMCMCGHACVCVRVCEPPQKNKAGSRLENYGSGRTGFHPGKSSLAVPPGEVEE